MSERVWFITGASTGFGRDIAELVLERGDRVVATARRPEMLAALVARFPETALACRLDVTVADEIHAAVHAAEARFGHIDVLLNNAGYVQTGAVEELSATEFRRVFDTNFFGMIEATRAVLPGMRARRSGTILMMSAMGAHFAAPGISAYCATKAAMESVGEALAAEVAPLGIRVMLIEPGAFRTDVLTAARQPERSIADYDATAGPLKQRFATSHGTQRGDPRKAMRMILDALDSPVQTLRLPIGADALAMIRGKIERVGADLDAWDVAARATDIE